MRLHHCLTKTTLLLVGLLSVIISKAQETGSSFEKITKEVAAYKQRGYLDIPQTVYL